MRSRIWISAVLAGVIVVVLSVPAPAHHSLPTFFDVEKIVQVVGVVKSVRIMNPHSEILFEVTDSNGQKAEWVGVSGSSAQMTRAGWTNDTLKVGSTVTVEGNPVRRAGAKGILVKSFTLADGRKITASEVN